MTLEPRGMWVLRIPNERIVRMQMKDMVFSSEAQKVLAYADVEACRLRHMFVSTEHLLLALHLGSPDLPIRGALIGDSTIFLKA